MTKKAESNNPHHFILYLLRANMKRFFKMMCSVCLKLVKTIIDGFMLLKSNKKNPKVISIRVRVKLISNTILVKPIKELKTSKYSFGTKLKDKSSKYKLHINSSPHALSFPILKAAKSSSTHIRNLNSVMGYCTVSTVKLESMKWSLQ